MIGFDVGSNSGFLDTNIVIHSVGNDSHTSECIAFLKEIQAGRIRVRIDPLVIHELTYSLSRVRHTMTHLEIAAFLNELISMKGIDGDVLVIAEALRRWAATPELGFVDAYLAAVSIRDSCPVYTKNIKHFRPFGVDAPNPLIAASASLD